MPPCRFFARPFSCFPSPSAPSQPVVAVPRKSADWNHATSRVLCAFHVLNAVEVFVVRLLAAVPIIGGILRLNQQFRYGRAAVSPHRHYTSLTCPMARKAVGRCFHHAAERCSVIPLGRHGGERFIVLADGPISSDGQRRASFCLLGDPGHQYSSGRPRFGRST
jgi:hypothetical protein